ncbi:MAG: polyprenyl synthetase family protein [Candidatus Omnitrophica bacterium]|nr:polyprenyl synthetase family protein [Candidatus Omnitrophota bacterium]
MKYEIYFKRYLALIEKKLEEVLPPPSQYPSVIHEAMRYAVLGAGKRFRPVLTMAAAEACGGSAEEALVPACSLELIHSYSLIHDDLPALDNDDLRRGKPTCHKQYGEAVAILAGDGLLTLAFYLLSKVEPAKRALRLVEEISTAAGTYGMIGGQVSDLIESKKDIDLPTLDYISTHKTGKLIKASAVCGAIVAAASSDIYRKMLHYGEYVGLAFQSVDDFIDEDGYTRVIKPKDLKQKIRDLIAKAKREVRPLGRKAEKLQALADILLRRVPKIKNYEQVDR